MKPGVKRPSIVISAAIMLIIMIAATSLGAYADTVYGVWSEWSTEKPESKTNRTIETKTQYRYRDKRYTSQEDNSTLSGWTLYNSEKKYGPWSAYSRTETDKILYPRGEAESVFDHNEYVMGHYCLGYVGAGNVNNYAVSWSGTTTNDYFNAHRVYHELGTFTESSVNSNFYAHGELSGKTMYLHGSSSTSTCTRCSNTVYSWFKLKTITVYNTRYRDITTVYYFYQWPSDWSAWSDSGVSATSDRQVETRTLYRYKDTKTESTPKAGLTASGSVSSSKVLTLKVSDELGLKGYYFGTSSSYKSNTYYQLQSETSYSTTRKATSAGTYYLTAVNNQNRVSKTAKITLYQITLKGNGGTVSPSKLILKSGQTAKLPTPKNGAYGFLGWAKSKTASSGITKLTVSADATYYALWGNISSAAWSKENQYSFGNTYSSFTSVYTMKDREWNKLKKYINRYYDEDRAESMIDEINKARVSSWGGSCYGMSLSAILDYTGQIGMNENFGGASSVSKLAVPSSAEGADTLSAINYYHLLQYADDIREAYASAYSTSDNWTSSLKQLVSKAKKGELISFLYAWFVNGRLAGHSIVIKGYSGTDSNGNYVLKVYDNRFPSQDIQILVASDYRSCTVRTPYSDEQCYYVSYLSNYVVYDRYDIDGAENDMKISSKSSSEKVSVSGTTIKTSLANNVTIKNSSGKSVIIKNGKISASSTAKILSESLIVSSTADGTTQTPELVLRLADSDYFTFEASGGKVDVTVTSDSSFTSVQATKASSVVVSEKEGVYLNGDNVTYSVTRSVDEETFDMFSFSGVSTGSANVDYSDGKVLVSGNVEGTVQVNKISDSEWQTMSFESKKENVAVDMFGCEKHTYKTKVVSKATTSKNGCSYRYCTKCGHREDKKTIYKIDSVKLSTTSYTYNGKVKRPDVTVKNSKGTTLKQGTDYTVTYSSGRKLPGTYKVTVTFTGSYKGTVTKSFTIKVGAPKISKLTAGTKKATLTWDKVSNVTGYEVWYATSSGEYKKAGTTSNTSYTKKSLTTGKTYKFKIRSYKTIDGKKYYSGYSAVKSVKVK